MYTLYGDGIHDDYPAIQEMIDSGVCEINLPAPQKNYLISSTLILPSNFRLTLPRFAEIKLKDGANCLMVQSKTVLSHKERFRETDPEKYRNTFYYINEFSPEEEDSTQNIEICGGIWNFNNLNQNDNPQLTNVFEPKGYLGYGMLFFNTKNLKLSSLTLKNPVNYAVSLDKVSCFTVEDITFDFNYGKSIAINMDGIHINGNCHNGVIRNLKGACYDDLVALNADEGTDGDITNIEIDGLFANDCHSAVRLLTVKRNLKNISISNVYGTYYQYCIAISKFYKGETEGYFDGITLRNIYTAKAEKLPIYCKTPNSYVFPLIWIQGECHVKNLKIDTLHRREYNVPVESFFVGENATVENMIIDNITVENYTESEIPFFVNNGDIKYLNLKNIRPKNSLIIGDGNIECIKK